MDLVSRSALLYGSSPALFSAAGSLSFRHYATKASSIAQTLRKKGLQVGSTVSVIAPNSPDTALLGIALLQAGMVFAPMNHRFPLQQLIIALKALKPDIVLTSLPADPAFRTEPLEALLTETPDAGHPEPAAAPHCMERIVTIIHTSASSGKAKAAMHSFGNHWYNALGASENMPLGPGDCALLSLPLFHVGGYAILFRALASGSAVAVPPPHEPIEHSLERFPLTHLSLVPTQLHRLLLNPTAVPLLRRLKAVLLGGSAVPIRLLEETEQLGIPVYMSYGSTEMCSQIATTSEPASSFRKTSCRSLPFRELSIANDGEILVKGPCLFQGYIVEGKPVLPLDSDGWFHTGDTGNIDKSGNLSVHGRKDNMFISGGENLHPEEIECALTSIEGIKEALVVPIQEREFGWKPAAFIKTEKSDQPADSVITEAMLKTVGRLKTPIRYIRVCQWVTLPGSQKIDRKRYVRQISEENGW
ncbi:MAG: o-succinylbenzoate--CoA ligase [Chlorobium sp.]|uniref:o-succinylbenzoate--CoA ligase n=1 Tax=Chlorobium sp. TaxID=1095 RepID=UPI0025B870FA|nr:o-succinylbenzoate--CoA ligase [Chlorobium sp.]MCF8216086.1 o-succinylbenzoate--CoA ligase [Chlorobium sp.]MCF8270987.1 o-succinylbenzoate--CoA ligase [Chlorobium sp.]MCF8287367.1 o-succinylbenzoate--CoA ligase [Chlorobium sp.]MCF8290900.1 o-succinylbenzoate--CoA ligase [Chlorobium sp.]MCF8384995.1 o-succinylbenzoate--CoA ligase [Chlorobium sp.]